MESSGRADLPQQFVAALEAEPRARHAFERASDSYRNGLVALVNETRDLEHQAERIELVIKTLLQHRS